MEELENLRSLAEISVALTGFTGIVATFGKRKDGEWDPLEKLRLKMLLETSLGVLVMTLVSLMLYSLRLTELALWRWSNGILAVIHFSGVLLLAWRISKMKASTLPKEEIISLFLLLPVSLAFIGAHTAISIGYWPARGFFVLFAGLVYLLLLSAFHFVLLLFQENQ